MAFKVLKREVIGGRNVTLTGPGNGDDKRSLLAIELDGELMEAIEKHGEVRLKVDSADLLTLWGGVARMYLEREDIDADSDLVIETATANMRELVERAYQQRRGKPIPGKAGHYYCAICGVLPMVPLAGEECCEACTSGMTTTLLASIVGAPPPRVVEFPPPLPTGEVVYHHLHHGWTTCEFSRLHGLPGAWPPGHKWTREWSETNCQACLDGRTDGDSTQ